MNATIKLPKSTRATQSLFRKGKLGKARTSAVAPAAEVKPLSSSEKVEFQKHEETIRHHLDTFDAAGQALVAIRDGRLYRESHATFEAYCRERWDMSKTQANRLIAAAKVVQSISASFSVVPETESQIRPLTNLSPKQQKKVWSKVVTGAKNTESGKVTAKLVEDVARKTVPSAFKTPERQTVKRIELPELVTRFNEWAKTNAQIITKSSGPEVVKLVQVFLRSL